MVMYRAVRAFESNAEEELNSENMTVYRVHCGPLLGFFVE